MKVAGSATLHAARTDVWKALNDPAVLLRTIPGCQRLEAIGTDAYAMTVTMGVASISGSYQGEVRLTEQRLYESLVLKAAGAGAPGTVNADVVVRLGEDDPTTTTVTYDADATVGGMIGGVGQRMLSGVAKKTAGQFFDAVDDVLTGNAAAPPAGPSTPDGVAAAGPGERVADVWEVPTPAGAPGPGFAVGVAVGAAAALAGAVVGGWLARRRD